MKDQMLLKRWQAWSTEHLSRKPVPVFDCPLHKEMSSLNLPWHSFENPHPSSHWITWEKSSAPPSPLPHPRKRQRAMRLSLTLLFSKLGKSKVPTHCSQDILWSPLTYMSFTLLLWMHSRTSRSFLNCGDQNCPQCWRWGWTKRRIIISSDSWSLLLAGL